MPIPPIVWTICASHFGLASLNNLSTSIAVSHGSRSPNDNREFAGDAWRGIPEAEIDIERIDLRYRRPVALRRSELEEFDPMSYRLGEEIVIAREDLHDLRARFIGEDQECSNGNRDCRNEDSVPSHTDFESTSEDAE
jgi:hypothetical protein